MQAISRIYTAIAGCPRGQETSFDYLAISELLHDVHGGVVSCVEKTVRSTSFDDRERVLADMGWRVIAPGWTRHVDADRVEYRAVITPNLRVVRDEEGFHLRAVR